MPILYMLHDWDDNIRPADEIYMTSGYYAALAEFAQFIRRANDTTVRGVPPIGIWTGKDQKEVENAMELLPKPDAWSCFESGVLLANLHTGDETYHPLLTPETRARFREVKELVIPALLANNPNLKLYEGVKEICIAIERIDTKVPIQTYLARVKEALQGYAKAKNLRYEGGEVTYEHIFEVDYSSIAIDIRPRGVNKSTALDILTRETGVRPENILGTGDSRGDFPMLERVRFVGCSSNASEECREFIAARGDTGYISELPFVAGVNDIMRHFLEI